MQQIFVSIIMSAFNEGKTIRGSIQSIQQQTYKNWELIIVNDASTDETRAVIINLQASDNRIILIDNPKNEGLAKSLNFALEKAKGDYVARMDADDLSMPYRIERQIDFLIKNKHIDVLGSGAIEFNTGINYQATVFRQEFHHLIVENILIACPFIHPTVMAKKTFFIENHGYDTKLRRSQDYDLWLRTYKKYKFHNLPEPLLYYHRRNTYKWRDTFYGAMVIVKHIKANKLNILYYWFPLRLFIAFFKFKLSKWITLNSR